MKMNSKNLNVGRLYFRFLSIISVLILSACTTLPESADAPQEFTDDAVVVIINDPRPQRRKQSSVNIGYQARVNYAKDPLLNRISESIARDYGVNVSYQWPIESLDVHCFVIETTEPTELIAQLNADTRVRSAQKLNRFVSKGIDETEDQNKIKLNQEKPKKKKPKKKKIFNPTTSQNKFHINNTFGAGQRIAIVDTGADIQHPDLINSNLKQWDFVGTTRGQSKERHGTAVLGLISAQHANGEGIDGVAPRANVGVFRACWQPQENAIRAACDTVTLSLALDAVLRWKPDIVNLSLSGPPDQLLEEFIKIMDSKGIIVVAAFDENRDKKQRFPLERNNVLFAYGKNEKPNPLVDSTVITMGNKDAFTLQPDGAYDVLNGHSMAAPIVSAMLALHKETKPNASNQAIIEELKLMELE